MGAIDSTLAQVNEVAVSALEGTGWKVLHLYYAFNTLSPFYKTGINLVIGDLKRRALGVNLGRETTTGQVRKEVDNIVKILNSDEANDMELVV